MAYNKFITKDNTVLLDLTADDVTADKLIKGITSHDKFGAKITGTFSIDDELSTQDDLITQIQTALEGKAAGGSTEDLDSVIAELETKTATLNATLANKAAGSGGSIETCTINVSGYYNQTDIAAYTAYSNGLFTSVIEGSPNHEFDGVLSDVVCGSVVVFPGYYIAGECSDGELVYQGPRATYYRAPLQANTVANVTLMQD